MKIKKSLIASLLMLLVILLLSFLVPYRIMLWICLLLPVPLAIGIAVIAGAGKKTKRMKACLSVLVTIAVVCVMGCFLFGFGRYTFVDGAFMPFWPIPLVGSLIVSVPLAIKMLRGKCGVGWTILSLFLCVIVAFAVLNVYAEHLNYLLDFSEPEIYTAVIERKDLTLHKKAPDTYEFRLTVNGQAIWLDVSQGDYYSYEVGDEFSFACYNGAFDEAFYVS